MNFGHVPLEDAEGAILAHSVGFEGGRLRKGTVIGPREVAQLRAAGISDVTVARLGSCDVEENEAASRIAGQLAAPGLRVTDAFTGRVNLHAERAGLIQVDRAAIDALNAIDEAITVATLPHLARVEAGAMVATIKIIPYAVPNDALERAVAACVEPPLHLAPFRALSCQIVLTRTPGLKDHVLEKGGAVTKARLSALGLAAPDPVVVDHDSAALTDVLLGLDGDLVLILGGSATSDRGDTVPAAIAAAGGQILRFGMPVDPGNLLLLARQGGRHVVGLPGCARSPALNGADWVLERLVAGIPITDGDIAGMGVGGLLKEIPSRPQPRQKAGAARAAILLLAAGAGTRMRGRDKLLEQVDGQPLLRVLAKRALASQAAAVVVAVPEGHQERIAALDGLNVDVVEVRDAAEGMSASLRAAIGQVNGEAALVMLADMPDITTTLLDRLIARTGSQGGREIVRPALRDGRAGHPVLFGKAHFAALAQVEGDRGARDVIAAHSAMLDLVEVDGDSPLVDLDTPEAWARWRAERAS